MSMKMRLFARQMPNGCQMSVEAAQFDPAVRPWPEQLIPWSRSPVQPRDMSFGYVQNKSFGSLHTAGKVHVRALDWIVMEPSGQWTVWADEQFRRYHRDIQPGEPPFDDVAEAQTNVPRMFRRGLRAAIRAGLWRSGR